MEWGGREGGRGEELRERERERGLHYIIHSEKLIKLCHSHKINADY